MYIYKTRTLIMKYSQSALSIHREILSSLLSTLAAVFDPCLAATFLFYEQNLVFVSITVHLVVVSAAITCRFGV